MTPEEREELCEELAQKVTDDAPIEVLMQFFYEDQLMYFEGLSDEDLLESAEEVLQ